jgi:hypothetical protein
VSHFACLIFIHGAEDLSCRREIAQDIKSIRDPTHKQLTQIVDRRTKLTRQIKRLRALQLLFSPISLQIIATIPPSTAAVNAEDIPLFLPSQLSCTQRENPELYNPALTEIEIRLRDAQLNESLNQLRNSLLIKQRLLSYKKANSRHQGANTRSRNLLTRQDRKVKLAALTYQRAWNAKLGLVGDITLVNWNPLREGDIVCMEDLQEVENRNIRAAKHQRAEAARRVLNGESAMKGAREKHRVVSWIWHGVSTEELSMDSTLYHGKCESKS